VTEPRWLSVEEILRLHEIQIQRYGGRPGVRDEGLLESAVLRPRNQLHYDPVANVVDLGATYVIALSANHPFFDGNKRTAFYAMAVFLEMNGLPLRASESDATRAMLDLAAGASSPDEFKNWVRRFVL